MGTLIIFNIILILIITALLVAVKKWVCSERGKRVVLFVAPLVTVAIHYSSFFYQLIFNVLVSAEEAYNVNSMFIIHSPFDGVPFLRYPIIALLGLVIYFVIFIVCDVITAPRGERCFNKIK